MLIEVVHVNGQYSPESGKHLPPTGIDAGYYERLASKLHVASELGAITLYRPNLMSFSHDIFSDLDEVARSLDTDPFLAMIGDMGRLYVVPDGRKPLEQTCRDFALENALLRRCGQGVVLGAYLGVCVPGVAWDLALRNPRIMVGIDSALSVDGGHSDLRPEYGHIRHTPIVSE